MSIEDIALKYFNVLPQTEINSSTKSCPFHAVFRYFLFDDIKQYAAISTTHSRYFIKLLEEQKLLASSLSTIW